MDDAIAGTSSEQAKLRTRLDALKPSVSAAVRLSQASQVLRRAGHLKPRQFGVGDAVLARDYRGRERWPSGVVTAQSGPVSYTVDVGTSEEWRRHADQLLSIPNQTAKTQFTELPDNKNVSVPVQTSVNATSPAPTTREQVVYSNISADSRLPYIPPTQKNHFLPSSWISRHSNDFMCKQAIVIKLMYASVNIKVGIQNLNLRSSGSSFTPTIDGNTWSRSRQHRLSISVSVGNSHISTTGCCLPVSSHPLRGRVSGATLLQNGQGGQTVGPAATGSRQSMQGVVLDDEQTEVPSRETGRA
ncbi:hypothetical protein QQF64_025448 [Cirrhinus molitorella]|uniref:Uncharacterized protein n=1 Tax=Cirrhinus molitorella TaxID=172907 RepID=A0ABR3NP13_9TELE